MHWRWSLGHSCRCSLGHSCRCSLGHSCRCSLGHSCRCSRGYVCSFSYEYADSCCQGSSDYNQWYSDGCSRGTLSRRYVVAVDATLADGYSRGYFEGCCRRYSGRFGPILYDEYPATLNLQSCICSWKLNKSAALLLFYTFEQFFSLKISSSSIIYWVLRADLHFFIRWYYRQMENLKALYKGFMKEDNIRTG